MGFRNLTASEEEILRQNGICSDDVSVVSSSDDSLVLLNHCTRDNIMIFAGEKSRRLHLFGKSQTSGKTKGEKTE